MRRLTAHVAKTPLFTTKACVLRSYSAPQLASSKAHYLSPGTVFLQHLSGSLSLPKSNLDDQCGVLATYFPSKLPLSVNFCRQALRLRNIRSQRASFEPLPKTCHFHRQGRSFRVFQDPQKECRETYFSRQARCFSTFYMLFVPYLGTLYSTGAVDSPHYVTTAGGRKWLPQHLGADLY